MNKKWQFGLFLIGLSLCTASINALALGTKTFGLDDLSSISVAPLKSSFSIQDTLLPYPSNRLMFIPTTITTVLPFTSFTLTMKAYALPIIQVSDPKAKSELVTPEFLESNGKVVMTKSVEYRCSRLNTRVNASNSFSCDPASFSDRYNFPENHAVYMVLTYTGNYEDPRQLLEADYWKATNRAKFMRGRMDQKSGMAVLTWEFRGFGESSIGWATLLDCLDNKAPRMLMVKK